MVTLNLSELTSPHYLAYKWIIDNIPSDTKNILDFGARYSKLPSLLSQKYDVTVYDRDPIVKNQKVKHIVGHDGEGIEGEYDCIISCWAIQHNDLEKQEEILEKLLKHLKPSGAFLIVNKFSTGDSFYQENRADPCWVLNFEASILTYSIRRKLVLSKIGYFWYEHASIKGDYCEPNKANAICLRLQAPAKLGE